jgi:hypothetical protein
LTTFVFDSFHILCWLNINRVTANL